VIPEVLRGQPCGIGGEQTSESGLPIPIGELEFAGGGDGAIDGGEQEVLAAGESLVALEGKNRIQQGDEIESLSDVKEGGDIAEGSDIAMEGLGRLAGLLNGGDEILEFAEVEGADDLGFAVYALRVAGIVVGMSVDHLEGQTRHI